MINFKFSETLKTFLGESGNNVVKKANPRVWKPAIFRSNTLFKINIKYKITFLIVLIFIIQFSNNKNKKIKK